MIGILVGDFCIFYTVILSYTYLDDLYTWVNPGKQLWTIGLRIE